MPAVRPYENGDLHQEQQEEDRLVGAEPFTDAVTVALAAEHFLRSDADRKAAQFALRIIEVARRFEVHVLEEAPLVDERNRPRTVAGAN